MFVGVGIPCWLEGDNKQFNRNVLTRLGEAQVVVTGEWRRLSCAALHYTFESQPLRLASFQVHRTMCSHYCQFPTTPRVCFWYPVFWPRNDHDEFLDNKNFIYVHVLKRGAVVNRTLAVPYINILLMEKQSDVRSIE